MPVAGQHGPGAGKPRVTPGLSSHSTLQKRTFLSEKRLRRRISPQPRYVAVAVPCWGGFGTVKSGVVLRNRWLFLPVRSDCVRMR